MSAGGFKRPRALFRQVGRRVRPAYGRAIGADVRRGMIPAVLRSRQSGNGPEVKSVDLSGTPSFTQAGTVTLLTVPVEGASFYNRIGRRIRMKSIQIKGAITPGLGNAAADTATLGRVMVLYDRQPNGALPSVADIITDYTSAGATSTTTRSGLNMNNRDRFVVLMDQFVVLPAVGISGVAPAATIYYADPNNNAGGAEQGQLLINRFIKLKGLESHFKASAGAIGDISTGSLIMLTIASDSANAGGSYTLAFEDRVKFLD